MWYVGVFFSSVILMILAWSLYDWIVDSFLSQIKKELRVSIDRLQNIEARVLKLEAKKKK